MVGNTLPICMLHPSQSEEKTHKKLTSITDSNNPPDTAGRSACHSKQLRLPQQATSPATASRGVGLRKWRNALSEGVLNPNRSLDNYAQTSFLFVICLSRFSVTMEPHCALETTKHLFKNKSYYHHNANERFGLNLFEPCSFL
ncbi:MAG: hypothetical protein K5945_06955 [Bacteroidaceae bacterium]|nr:hypothetical protein [Bacteroidaceae bacterium]